MVLALIGMSGIGKTAWAGRLADAGFACLPCDDLIAARLRARFTIASPSLYDVGAWMGMPHEAHFAEREAAYLACEAAVLREIAGDVLEHHAPGRRLVIDLTGSAVYADPAILAAIRRAATVVHLAAGPAHHRQLLQAYLARPRPVVWNGVYRPEPNEPPDAALARCYGRLLAQREVLYAALSHVRLDAAVHSDPSFSVDAFVRAVNAHGDAPR